MEHLSGAADMAAARRFRESEVEVLRALSIAPSDVRALKLLALVRFKLGRLDEARAVCRELVALLPRDAGVRMKLGLIALTLDRLDESVNELEASARLNPDDLRVWSYLGFAYSRRGEPAQAATAFRRAGQEVRAEEAERAGSMSSSDGRDAAPPLTAAPTRMKHHDTGAEAAVVGSADAVPGVEAAFDFSAGDGETIPPSPLIGYAVSLLASSARSAAWVGSTARLPIGDEVFVRTAAAVACSGTARWEPAHRRVRGRTTDEQLGGGHGHGAGSQPFCRVTGRGDVFVAAPVGRLVPLRLEDDILYVREDRVLAFEGSVAWEYGHVPGSHVDVKMLQFRGSGLVAIRVDGQPGAVKVTPEKSLYVSASHLLGWVGRLAASGTTGTRPAASGIEEIGWGDAAPFGIMCEGEGVVLMDVTAGDGAAKPIAHAFSRESQ